MYLKLIVLLLLIPVIYLHGKYEDEFPLWVSILVGLCLLGYALNDILKRRRKGQTWNQAVAQGNKLITGSVWKDAVLLFVIFFVLFVLPIALMSLYAVLKP